MAKNAEQPHLQAARRDSGQDNRADQPRGKTTM